MSDASSPNIQSLDAEVDFISLIIQPETSAPGETETPQLVGFPAPLTSFVGRMQEIATLAELVRREMTTARDLSVPLKVDLASGPNWLDVEPLPG